MALSQYFCFEITNYLNQKEFSVFKEEPKTKQNKTDKERYLQENHFSAPLLSQESRPQKVNFKNLLEKKPYKRKFLNLSLENSYQGEKQIWWCLQLYNIGEPL